MSDKDNPRPARMRRKRHRILKATALIFAAAAAAAVIFAAGVTLWLTPSRLSDIVSRECGSRLLAEVRIYGAGWSFWSTFPDFYLTADSVEVVSRSLRNAPADVRHALPAGSDTLLTAGALRAGINLPEALRGDIALRDISISHPALNLVAYGNGIDNFSIIPPSGGKHDIKHISADTILLEAPVKVSVYEHTGHTSASVTLDNFLLSCAGSTDTYRISFSGNLNGTVRSVALDGGIPLDIRGDIHASFAPLRLSLAGFKVAGAGLSSVTDMDMTFGRSPEIENLSTNITTDDALPFLKNLRHPGISFTKGAQGKVPARIDLSLTRPYPLAIRNGLPALPADIPAFTMNLEIKDAEARLSSGKSRKLSLSDLNLSAFLDIDPENEAANRLELYLCSASTNTGKFSLAGSAEELLSGNPLIRADVECAADIAELTSAIFPSSPLRLSGDVSANASLSCRLADIKKKEADDINIKGVFSSPLLRISDSVRKLYAILSGWSLRLDALLPSLSGSDLSDGKIRLASEFDGEISESPSGTPTVSIAGARVSALLGATLSGGTPTVAGKINVDGSGLSIVSGKCSFNSGALSMALDASLRHTPWQPGEPFSTPSSPGDSLTARHARHTPLQLTPSLPPMMQTALSLLNLKGDISINSGTLMAQAYPAPLSFSGLSVRTDLDSLTINSLHAQLRSNTADISGTVSGLRGFLSAQAPSLLKIDLRADFSDLNVNELAGTYYAGVENTTGKPADYTVAKPGRWNRADSLCVAIPRNIDAVVRLRSDRAEYRGWSFSPLSTVLSVHDGDARIGNLSVGAPYGTAILDWTYSTADLDDIYMDLTLGIDNFDLDSFFTAFPSLTESVPQLAGVSGTLSADAEGHFLMFPDMFLNAPSLEGELTLNADSLSYARDRKTAHLTHLLLLKGDGPLRADNFTAHASFHDNLLCVDPFVIRCGGYDVEADGVNNLQGDIYYHFGFLRNPFHIPFGINLTGTRRNPRIRFGGVGTKDGAEREISSDLHDSVNVNIMHGLRYGWLLFIKNAAKYDALNNHGYVSDVL